MAEITENSKTERIISIKETFDDGIGLLELSFNEEKINRIYYEYSFEKPLSSGGPHTETLIITESSNDFMYLINELYKNARTWTNYKIMK